jgi:hypothetical protein
MKRSLAALALLAALPFPAQAERYRVDLVVFLDRGGMTTELPKPFVPPDLSRALEPDAAALTGSGLELIPDTAFGLTEVWNRLRYSKRYQPLVKLAFLHSDPGTDRVLPLRIRSGQPLPVTAMPVTAPTTTTSTPGMPASPTPAYQTVDGTIALRLSRYLFLDADLYYTQAMPDGRLASYHLKEVRKMRRDELHYLDSPKLGIVAKVTKAPVQSTGALSEAPKGRVEGPPAAQPPKP